MVDKQGSDDRRLTVQQVRMLIRMDDSKFSLVTDSEVSVKRSMGAGLPSADDQGVPVRKEDEKRRRRVLIRQSMMGQRRSAGQLVGAHRDGETRPRDEYTRTTRLQD